MDKLQEIKERMGPFLGEFPPHAIMPLEEMLPARTSVAELPDKLDELAVCIEISARNLSTRHHSWWQKMSSRVIHVRNWLDLSAARLRADAVGGDPIKKQQALNFIAEIAAGDPCFRFDPSPQMLNVRDLADHQYAVARDYPGRYVVMNGIDVLGVYDNHKEAEQRYYLACRSEPGHRPVIIPPDRSRAQPPVMRGRSLVGRLPKKP